MKRVVSMVCLLLFSSARAQQRGPLPVVPEAEAVQILAEAKPRLPKFEAALEELRTRDPLLKRIVWVRAEGPGSGPAFAAPDGTVRIDVSFVERARPAFGDDRMVVVLEHEVGHLHYFARVPREERTSEESEKAAFEYSLADGKRRAEEGDCGPLRVGLFFMRRRSESDDLGDAHVRALKRIVPGPRFAEYAGWAAEHCKAVAGDSAAPE